MRHNSLAVLQLTASPASPPFFSFFAHLACHETMTASMNTHSADSQSTPNHQILGDELNAEPTIERPLNGGEVTGGVVRVGSTVRRWPAPNAEFAHQLLMYLDGVGFDAVPRYLGSDQQGREILSFVDGWVPPGLEYGAWSEGQLIAAARLLRRFHDVTSRSPLAGGNEVVRHGDPNPTNMVWRNGTPIALLDFDNARPGTRIDDIAYMCWMFVTSGQDEGMVGLRLRGRRPALICDAYGLSERGQLFDAIIDQQAAAAELVLREADLPRSKRGPVEVFDTIAWVTGETAWLKRHRDDLEPFLQEPGLETQR
jgi:Phosphotransferase enzyme family